jgi:hypothetical protein
MPNKSRQTTIFASLRLCWATPLSHKLNNTKMRLLQVLHVNEAIMYCIKNICTQFYFCNTFNDTMEVY